MKYFFSHLIEMESVIIQLDKLDLSKKQKIHLTTLIDSSLHHIILDAILSELNDAEKRVFVQRLTEGNHDKIWKFLNEKIDGVENKIIKAAQQLKTQLQKDFQQAKNKVN